MKVVQIGVAQSAHDPLGMPEAASPAVRPEREAEPTFDDGGYGRRSYVQTSIWGPLVGTVPLPRLAFFFRQLSTMLRAGVPYVQSLDTLSTQTGSSNLGAIVRELRTHVEAGRPISFGMQRYPEVFSPVMLSMVRTGEEGGMLDQTLAYVADYLDREIKLRNLYRRVTFYPKLQIGASIVIIVAANAVIAVMAPGQPGLSSPLTTPSTWIWLGPLLIGLFFFVKWGLANPRVKHLWDAFISGLPYIGTTIRQLAMAKFGRALGALYHAGVPVTRAIPLAADACGNEWLRERVYPAGRALESGVGIAETLRSTNAFSPIVLDMVATGERTGNLDQMLHQVAQYYEDEGETRSTQFGYTIGVVVGLLVAVYIAYVVITFYMGRAAGFQQQMN
jgi:type II secretory pathway component PulF